MTLKNFIEGLQILSRYYDDPEGYHIGAEHDIFYAYPTDTPVSDSDFKRLVELLWFQPEVDPEEDESSKYCPEEGWGAFT